MIGYIEGTLIYKRENALVVSAQGVGYKLFATEKSIGNAVIGQTYAYYTYLAVRETALDLYGFPNKEDLEYFELLLGVSGIGPKTALGVLNNASAQSIRQAVVSNEPAHLHSHSGISKKNAEKIVRELTGKIAALPDDDFSDTYTPDNDTIDALLALGYSNKQALETVKHIPEDITRTEERITYALKKLGS